MIKQIGLIFLLLCFACAFAQNKQPQGVVYNADILKVADGDTIVIAAPYLPAPLKPQLSVRIFGVDTPEKDFRAKCTVENQKGYAATTFTQNAVSKATQRHVVLYSWDKFGGRVLGDILLDGKSLRAMLIAKGYAREYYGDVKQSWCN